MTTQHSTAAFATARPYGVPAIVDQLRQRGKFRVSNRTDYRTGHVHWRTARTLARLGFAEFSTNGKWIQPEGRGGPRFDA